MIKILNYKNSLSLKKLSTFLERRRFAENKDIGIVQNILKDIKKNKVKALKKYELRFGNNTQINISKDQIKKSIKNLDPKVKKAIDFAYNRIFNFHLKQKKTIGDILKFLNVKWSDNVTEFYKTAEKRGIINTPSYNQVSQPIYSNSMYRLSLIHI